MYEKFARAYDILMKDVDYKAIAAYIISVWERRGIHPNLVLDLCCGTGTESVILAQKGYEVIGVDASPEMLSVASEKAAKMGLNILFLNQKIEEMELYGTVDSIISICDSLNYVLDTDGLLQVFKLAANYLNDGGVFVFDINTKYKYKKILAQNVFAVNNKKCPYIWENFYDSKTKINEYTLTLFNKKRSGLYEKSTEYHYQRAYGKKEIKQLLIDAGFERIDIFGGYTFEKPQKRSERIVFVCQKKAMERHVND